MRMGLLPVLIASAIGISGAAIAAPAASLGGGAPASAHIEQVQYGGGGYGGGYNSGYKKKKAYCRNVKVCRDTYYGPPKCHWERVCH